MFSMRDDIWRVIYRLVNGLSNPYKKLNCGEEKTAEEHLQDMEQTMDKMSAEMDQDIEKAKSMAEESEEMLKDFEEKYPENKESEILFGDVVDKADVDREENPFHDVMDTIERNSEILKDIADRAEKLDKASEERKAESEKVDQEIQNCSDILDSMIKESAEESTESASEAAAETSKIQEEEKPASFTTDPFISLYGEKAGNWIFKNTTNSDMERIYDFVVVLAGLVKSKKGTKCEFVDDKYGIEDSIKSSLLYPIDILNLNYVILELRKQFGQKDIAFKAKKLTEYVEQYRKMVNGIVGQDTVDIFKKLFLDNSGYHIIYNMTNQDILYVKNFIRSLNTNYRLIWNTPSENILESKLELCKDDNFNEIRTLFNVIYPRISDEKIAHIIVNMYQEEISSEYIHSSVIKLNGYIKKIDNPILKNSGFVGADKVLYSKDRKVRDNISALLHMRNDLIDVVCDEVADRVDISKLDTINRVFLANLVTTINKISDKDLFVEEDYNNMEVVKVTSSMLQGIGLGRDVDTFPAAVVRRLIKDYAYAAISIINNMREVCRAISSVMVVILDEKPVNEEKALEVASEPVTATEEKAEEKKEEAEPVVVTEEKTEEEVPFDESTPIVVENDYEPFNPATMNMKEFLFNEFRKFFRPNEYFMIVENDDGTSGLDIMNGPNYYVTLVNGEAGIMTVGFIGNESYFIPVSIRSHRDLVFNLIYSNRLMLTDNEINEVLKTCVDPTVLPYLDQSNKYVRFSDPNDYPELNWKLRFIMEVIASKTGGQIPMLRFGKLKNINYFSLTTEGAVNCQKTFMNGSISETPIRIKVKGNNLKITMNGISEIIQMKK